MEGRVGWIWVGELNFHSNKNSHNDVAAFLLKLLFSLKVADLASTVIDEL